MSEQSIYSESSNSILDPVRKVEKSYSVIVQFCNLNGSSVSVLAEKDSTPQTAYSEWKENGFYEDVKQGEQLPFSLPSLQLIPYKGFPRSVVCNLLAEAGSGVNGRAPLRYHAVARGLHNLYLRLAEARDAGTAVEVHIPSTEQNRQVLQVLVAELAEDSKIPTTLYVGD
ncbi:hypothetical protein RYA05_00655 [Pseudomonas syringae pv. actinidiae]|uniref:hypothetical protein n=1 Tax=Pseudomonas viridiflava TaxID=33069 RepID=UPI0018E5E23B|nr:hypothetical protein [Pseudomonas viridiflava]MBI6726865.1 hypothetical protein [Pseudomonas viridiflava]MDU8350399.1 hypothetical protein [Pseudomonas syringae pv. actinidiae]